MTCTNTCMPQIVSVLVSWIPLNADLCTACCLQKSPFEEIEGASQVRPERRQAILGSKASGSFPGSVNMGKQRSGDNGLCKDKITRPHSSREVFLPGSGVWGFDVQLAMPEPDAWRRRTDTMTMRHPRCSNDVRSKGGRSAARKRGAEMGGAASGGASGDMFYKDLVERIHAAGTEETEQSLDSGVDGQRLSNLWGKAGASLKQGFLADEWTDWDDERPCVLDTKVSVYLHLDFCRAREERD